MSDSVGSVQVDTGGADESIWAGDGDDALVETDEEDDVIVLGDPALAAAATASPEEKVLVTAAYKLNILSTGPIASLCSVKRCIS